MKRITPWLTGLWGAVLEAWAELRIHKTRVLLSLIGVAVAVMALTTVVGLGQIAEQASVEQMERGSGRPAMLWVSAYSMTGTQPDTAAMGAAFQGAVDRYAVQYSSRSGYLESRVQFANGASPVSGQTVDADFGTMHRVAVDQGRWFTDADNDRLAPAIIVNQSFWESLGSPPLETHPTAEILGSTPITAVIVGVMPSTPWDETPWMYMLYSAWERITPPSLQAVQPPNYELWVPPELSEQLVPLIEREMTDALDGPFEVQVQRQDYLAYPGNLQSLMVIKFMVAGGAVLVLLLGALGLLNISLVTVRQRIREIGIRRSFGATAPRVFFAVMMESIVATFVAGLIGVVGAILVVQLPVVQELVSQGVTDTPPFPLEAALLGIVASVAVGALAGLLPALVAVRVKVIDAIRY